MCTMDVFHFLHKIFILVFLYIPHCGHVLYLFTFFISYTTVACRNGGGGGGVVL